MVNTWQPILRGVKIIGFLLAIILTSSIITIQSSRPAKAESLLYTVGCVVKGLVSTKCPTKTTPPAEPNNPSDPDPTNPNEEPSDPSGGGGSGSTNSGTETPPPLTIDQKALTKLPQMKELSPSAAGNGAGFTANVLPTIRGYEQMPSVLGATDVAALQPSDQGWRIVGVAWYWWLAAIAAIVGLGLVLKTTLLKSFFTVAKH